MPSFLILMVLWPIILYLDQNGKEVVTCHRLDGLIFDILPKEMEDSYKYITCDVVFGLTRQTQKNIYHGSQIHLYRMKLIKHGNC